MGKKEYKVIKVLDKKSFLTEIRGTKKEIKSYYLRQGKRIRFLKSIRR